MRGKRSLKRAGRRSSQAQFNFFFDCRRPVVARGIPRRIPVVSGCGGNDPNRRLMIKFKYGIATREEENSLHENVKNLIYKVIHTNRVGMDFGDVYQEIWKKIIKSRRTWDETKGTRVSTWIVVVANSVINSLRDGLFRRGRRICLYEDVMSGDGSGRTAEERIEDSLSGDFMEGYLRREGIGEFYSALTGEERRVLDTCMDMSEKIRTQRNLSLCKIPMRMVRCRLGMSEEALDAVISGMRSKFRRALGGDDAEE